MAGGVVRDLLAAHEDEPSGSVPSLRLAGALHRLVLERRAPELALHYPSVGGTAPVEEVWPAARARRREHLEALRALLARPVQTNEVGRSAVLYGALVLLGGPVRLLEVGASAGLNLRCDRFAYDVGAGEVLGDRRQPGAAGAALGWAAPGVRRVAAGRGPRGAATRARSTRRPPRAG